MRVDRQNRQNRWTYHPCPLSPLSGVNAFRTGDSLLLFFLLLPIEKERDRRRRGKEEGEQEEDNDDDDKVDGDIVGDA